MTTVPRPIQEIEDEIVEEFAQFEDSMDKYEYIIEQGRLLPPLEESAPCHVAGVEISPSHSD